MTNLKNSDIFTKFMIEYDKANIASSYPSLTDYEIATLLDKAYLALIAQKVTGNNPRKANFEQDTKAIEDIRPLITTSRELNIVANKSYAENDFVYSLPDNMLYYVSSRMKTFKATSSIDNASHNTQNISLMNHALCEKFLSTDNNLPWMANPVAFIEGNYLHVLVDLYKLKNAYTKDVYVTFVKTPNKFTSKNNEINTTSEFELSDTMAEELINLAIVFATNTVESSKLQSQTSLLSLES